jgi:hypothetical protein
MWALFFAGIVNGLVLAILEELSAAESERRAANPPQYAHPY